VIANQVERRTDQMFVQDRDRAVSRSQDMVQDLYNLHGSQCRSVRITDMILTEFTHVTVTSCTTALHHTSGQVTTTVMDTEYAFFLHMFTDMYTME
jgi:hypothetical protein